LECIFLFLSGCDGSGEVAAGLGGGGEVVVVVGWVRVAGACCGMSLDGAYRERVSV